MVGRNSCGVHEPINRLFVVARLQKTPVLADIECQAALLQTVELQAFGLIRSLYTIARIVGDFGEGAYPYAANTREIDIHTSSISLASKG